MPTADFLLADLRRPGRPMVALPVKIPADLLELLEYRADRLGCSRGALARSLIVRGMEALETAHAAWGETTPEDEELEALGEEGRHVLAAAA
jgi:hypothetical protein